MLKEIREHYGIAQSSFADYLGITRSHLSMAESGRRSLSAEITLELLPLFLAISQSTSKASGEELAKELAGQEEDLKKLIDWRKEEVENKLKLVEKRLSKMKADQERSRHILAGMESIKTEAKSTELGLLDIIEHTARKLQKKTGATTQLKLELQLQQLLAENAFLIKRRK